MFSMASESPGASRGPQTAQVSTTTLLNAIHNILSELPVSPSRCQHQSCCQHLAHSLAGRPNHRRLVGYESLGARTAARRRWLRNFEVRSTQRTASDSLSELTSANSSLHQSTPSVLAPFLTSFPFAIPSTLYKALDAIQPFLRCVTPYNPSTPRQAALGVTLTLNLTGDLTAASLALSQGGLDTVHGLLNIPSEAGYRAFDVFYYLLTSASTPARARVLGTPEPIHLHPLGPLRNL